MKQKWDKKGKVCSACAMLEYTECDHVRGGKTKYERENGTWSTRFTNREQRVSWQRGGGDNKTFPSGVCNGKKNR